MKYVRNLSYLIFVLLELYNVVIFQIRIRDDPSKPISVTGDENQDKCAFSIEVCRSL